MAATPSDGGARSGVLGGLLSRLGALFTPSRKAEDSSAEGAVPPLVCVLAGNPVTSAAILRCLNTADARHLRRLNPAVAGALLGIPWCDTDTPVVNAVRWRAALPAAVGARLTGRALEWRSSGYVSSAPTWAAGITHLDLHGSLQVSDDLLRRLPTSLRVLNVRDCEYLTGYASVAHLTALTSLDCGGTKVMTELADGLPPSLQVLNINKVYDSRPGASLAHLTQLRVLHADGSVVGDATLASLSPTLEVLHAAGCRGLTPAASFGHLTARRWLDAAHSAIGGASLATLPPSLTNLNVRGCGNIAPSSVLPRLPALRLLDVSDTAIGDVLVAALPASLTELLLARCRYVSGSARLDHLHALRLLHCNDTDLAPDVLAACRARGCVVPAAVILRGHDRAITALALVAGGRLASGDVDGEVRLWDVAAGGKATAVLKAGDVVRALATLRDGRRLAVGTALRAGECGYIEVWDVERERPSRPATINCRSGVRALAALADGRLAAGCGDGAVRVVDVDAGAVATTLTGHTSRVAALAVLPDGALASGSTDASVRVWDVGARSCVATLEGHTQPVTCLTVLVDGRLVSTGTGIGGDAVRLWDVATRTCVAVLARRTDWAAAVAALPDGRLATASTDDAIRLWDTRLAVAASASHAASVVPVEDVGLLGGVESLLPLPDGRLACGGGTGSMEAGAVYLLELPQPPAAYE